VGGSVDTARGVLEIVGALREALHRDEAALRGGVRYGARQDVDAACLVELEVALAAHIGKVGEYKAAFGHATPQKGRPNLSGRKLPNGLC